VTDFGYRIGFREYFSDLHDRNLLVNEGGNCFLISAYSGTDNFKGEIGWYRGRLESGFLAPIREHISKNTLLEGPEYRYDPSADDLAMEFSFEKAGDVKKYEFGQSDILPAPFAKLKDLYAPVMEELRAHPWKVLQAGIDLTGNDVRHGEYSEVGVTFRNAGSDRIVFGNPYAVSAGVAGFSLECERQNVPPEDFSQDDIFTIDLKKLEMRLSDREVVSSEVRLLELAPSAEINGTCRFRVPKCPPGEYEARLVYISKGMNEDLENQNFVDGELATGARPLVIRKR
jgi:hypothetical protein